MILKDNAVLRITDIAHLTWQGGEFQVAPRPFSVLSFRIRGSAEIESEGEKIRVSSQNLLYLPQGMGYRANYTETEMIAIHFVARHKDKEILAPAIYSPSEFHALFAKAAEFWEKKEPGYSTFAMAQIYNILGLLEEQEAKSNLPRHFLDAVSFINCHYNEPDISVELICSQAGIGATVFRQLFKKHYGQTPTEYLTRLRLEYARKLLSCGSTVERASYESGFSDPKYFARVVKKNFGCTPRSLKNFGK